MNISERLEYAVSQAQNWTLGSALEVVDSLKSDSSRSVDWDADAGEAWARVIDNGNVIALVSMEFPFVLAKEEDGFEIPVCENFIVVKVCSFEGDELSCFSAVLEVAFGRSGRLNILDPEGFSVNDLWYATV